MKNEEGRIFTINSKARGLFTSFFIFIPNFAINTRLRRKFSAQKSAGKIWDYPTNLVKSLTRFDPAALRADFANAKSGFMTGRSSNPLTRVGEWRIGTSPQDGRGSRGVNLLEIMVVVIIILIIAVLTFPQLTKMVEQGKLKEAHVNLELIRTGEQLYWLDNNFYTGAISSLRIDDPNTDSGRAFDYSIVSPVSPAVDPNNFTARATRRSGPYSGDTRSMQRDGDITNP
jgi:prepilin-type N-terminal cleavage/methylation domain-containing protein